MIIRKKFKFNGQHIVRNCSSERCKQSIHSHSYVVELFFTSSGLDNGQMVMDFGLMKGTIKEFINGFDNAYSMWSKEKDDFKTFIRKQSDKWIELPVSPSAESYSLMFLYVIDKIINATEFNNGEKNVQISSVRVHETTTGYAESFRTDLEYVNFSLNDIVLSDGVTSEFSNPDMYKEIVEYTKNGGNKPFINSVVKQQV